LLIHPSSFRSSFRCGSPPALSPSLAGSQRIGGREAADALTPDKLQFVDDVEQVLKSIGYDGSSFPSAAASAGATSNAAISSA
jgi:hypothetical protein